MLLKNEKRKMMKMNKIYICLTTIISLLVVSCNNQNPQTNVTTSKTANYTQNFDGLGFSITTPCELEDVSARASGDFIINYGGVKNPNDRANMAAYQVIVTNLPVGYKDLTKAQLEVFVDKALKNAVLGLTNVKKIYFSDEGYPGYIGYSNHNGLKQKGVMFFKEPNIIALTLMTNNNLEEKFNKFTNGFKTINSNNNVLEEQEEQRNYSKNALPKKYNHSKFSFNYPDSWAVVQENSRATATTTIAVQVMEQNVEVNEFAPNINVIISKDKHSESTSQLAKISYNQIKDAGLSCRLNGIKEITIDDNKGSVADYTVNMRGYNLRILQYFIKKNDNTIFTITFTLNNNKFSNQEKIANEIIESFSIL